MSKIYNNDKVIILTTTVKVHRVANISQKNPKDRLNCYIKAVKAWLDNTNFYIVLIDNSNYPFEEELKEYKIKNEKRFEIIYFDISLESRKKNNPLNTKYIGDVTKGRKKSKGMLEIYTVNYAYMNSRLIKKHNFIFFVKITGRYYVPDFDKLMYNFDTKKYNTIRQKIDLWNRCELLGTNKKYFNTLFDLNITPEEKHGISYVESLYNYRHRNKIPEGSVYVCNRLTLGWPTRRGGVNLDHTNL